MKSKKSPHVIALLFSVSLGLIAAWLGLRNQQDLPTRVLESGRIVLLPGQNTIYTGDPSAFGQATHIMDSNTETAALVAYPGNHPEGAHLLIDLALSHWPTTDGMQARKPVEIILFNGACQRCTISEFHRYARARRIRVQFLARRANNMDAEFIIPPAHALFTTEITLTDKPGPQHISLPIPAASPSRYWPENMRYYILKLTILDTYTRETLHPDRVALAEVVYVDRPAADNERKTDHLHYWVSRPEQMDIATYAN